jgi:hypothetical protein
MVNLEDIQTHLKRNYGEFERKNERELVKIVKWQVDTICH